MKYYWSLLLLCVLQCSFAQVRFGLKLGAGTTAVPDQELEIFDNGGLSRYGLSLAQAEYSIHGGLIIQAGIGKMFFLQPEVLFQTNKVDYRIEDFSVPGSPAQVLGEKYQYVNIPVLLGFRAGPLRLYGGPQGHIYLSSRSDLSALEGYRQDFKTMTYSWLAGAGLDVWKTLQLDVRYEGNFSTWGEHFNFFGNPVPFEQRPARILASVGILFGKK